MANPCGTRTPCPDSFWNISPSDAFFPPTSGTSSMPNSSKKRTYPGVLMTCPLVAHQAVGGIEHDAHVMLRRTRPGSLPDNAIRRGGTRTIGAFDVAVRCRTADSATDANLPRRHAPCQGRKSLDWVTLGRTSVEYETSDKALGRTRAGAGIGNPVSPEIGQWSRASVERLDHGIPLRRRQRRADPR